MRHGAIIGLVAIFSASFSGDASQATDIRPSISLDSIEQSASLAEVWALRGAAQGTAGEFLAEAANMPEKEASNFELRGFLGRSLQESHALQATIHDFNAAVRDHQAATAALLPVVSFEYDQGRTNTPSSLRRYNQEENQTSSLNLEWPVFRSGGTIAGIAASAFAAEAARFRVISAERQQVLESLGVYLQLLGASKQIEYLSKSRASLQKVLAGTQKRFQAGFASKTDIAEIRNEILTVTRELERLKLLETEQRLRWRSDTGSRAAKKLSWPNVKRLVPSTAQATVRKAVSNNPVINISNSEALSEQYRAKAGMAEFLPRVDLYGRVSREHAEPSRTRENDYEYSIGARLTVPLIDVASTARYRRSKERALASRYRAQDTERQIRRDVELAWNNLQSSRRQETLIKQQISTSRQIKAGLIREYEAGLRPVSDYLLHEVELAKLRQELVANRINTVTLAWQIALQFGSVSLAELTS